MDPKLVPWGGRRWLAQPPSPQFKKWHCRMKSRAVHASFFCRRHASPRHVVLSTRRRGVFSAFFPRYRRFAPRVIRFQTVHKKIFQRHKFSAHKTYSKPIRAPDPNCFWIHCTVIICYGTYFLLLFAIICYYLLLFVII